MYLESMDVLAKPFQGEMEQVAGFQVVDAMPMEDMPGDPLQVAVLRLDQAIPAVRVAPGNGSEDVVVERGAGHGGHVAIPS